MEKIRVVIRSDRAVIVIPLPVGFEALPLVEQRRELEASMAIALEQTYVGVERRVLQSA